MEPHPGPQHTDSSTAPPPAAFAIRDDRTNTCTFVAAAPPGHPRAAHLSAIISMLRNRNVCVTGAIIARIMMAPGNRALTVAPGIAITWIEEEPRQ